MIKGNILLVSYFVGLAAGIYAGTQVHPWPLAVLAVLATFVLVTLLTASIIQTGMHYTIAIRRELW